jgi:hypothetical protein
LLNILHYGFGPLRTIQFSKQFQKAPKHILQRESKWKWNTEKKRRTRHEPAHKW